MKSMDRRSWNVHKLNEATIPKKFRKKVKKPLWWNNDIYVLRKRKSRWWKKYSESKQYQDYLMYKKARNRATKVIRQSKRKLELKIAKKIKKDPKAFFKYARSKTSVKESVGPLTKKNGEVIIEDTKIANLLNDYFSSVFTLETVHNMPEIQDILNEQDEELTSLNVVEEAVKLKLQALKIDKSPGVDSIYPVLLKNVANEISRPLVKIFRLSLDTGIIPQDWKIANVTPILKGGSKYLVENYRPVSLTSVACKILESLIRDSITEHLRKYKLIKDTQHGFVQGRSCLSNLINFLDEVTKYIDKGLPVDIIYLDFSKAFDKVPHQRLLKKVASYGIKGEILQWIENWLHDGKQRVVVKGSSSNWSDVISGVPQGSVLGPTLFIIFINDIDEGVVSSLSKFADDTKLLRQVPEVEYAFTLQDDLKNLYKWSCDWQMLFNAGKCKCLHMGFNNMQFDYFMVDELIESTDAQKDLGVIVHKSLQSKYHVAKCVKTAKKNSGAVTIWFPYESLNIDPILRIHHIHALMDICLWNCLYWHILHACIYFQRCLHMCDSITN